MHVFFKCIAKKLFMNFLFLIDRINNYLLYLSISILYLFYISLHRRLYVVSPQIQKTNCKLFDLWVNKMRSKRCEFFKPCLVKSRIDFMYIIVMLSVMYLRWRKSFSLVQMESQFYVDISHESKSNTASFVAIVWITSTSLTCWFCRFFFVFFVKYR